MFKDLEERVLNGLKNIQMREELEAKVINMITLNRIWFNKMRFSTVKIAQEKSSIIKQEAPKDFSMLREETQDESASLVLRVQSSSTQNRHRYLVIMDWLRFPRRVTRYGRNN